MALLGMKKKQAFGALPQQVSPLQAYGDGSTPAMMQQPMPQQQPAQEQERFKPNILGVFGDAMQVFGGGQATYMNSVREQQERSELMRQRAMMAQQERETGWQDWVKKEEYKRANPSNANNDTANDWDFWDAKRKAGVITEEQFNDKMFAPRYIVDPATGQTIKIGGGPTFTPAPQGVTFTPIDGGQTATPSATFPRR
jgi:hypothetical protein